MPPYTVISEKSLDYEIPWMAAMYAVGAIATILLSAVICGCGKKKKKAKNVAPPVPEEKTANVEEKQTKLESKKAEVKSTKAGKSTKPETGGGISPPPADVGKCPAYLDLSCPGLPPEEKKRIAPSKRGIDECNPAYRTLMNDSKFQATDKAACVSKMKGQPATVPAVASARPAKMAATNPAYQTLMNLSEFKASKQASPSAKTAASLANTTKQSMITMKTAMVATQTKMN